MIPSLLDFHIIAILPLGKDGNLMVVGIVGTDLQVCPPVSDRASAQSLHARDVPTPP
jgi:hypothetical protein